MANTPLLNGWRPYRPSVISSGRAYSAPDPRFSNLRNSSYSSSSPDSENIVGPNDISTMFRQTGCQFTFTEGCVNGQNILTWSWTNDIYYISYRINGGSWTNLPCGTVSPLVNSNLTKGDNIEAQGICGVQIQWDEHEACGYTAYPANTNIYVFYDVTSMTYGDAKDFRQAVENWAHDFIGDNPGDYIGNIYHIPVLHERWVLWPSYPIHGELPVYYQMSTASPADDFQWNSVGQGGAGTGWGIEDCDIGSAGGAYGPKDDGTTYGTETNRLIPWKGPLVTSDELQNYDALANVQNSKGGGTQFPLGFTSLNMKDSQPQRPAWNVAGLASEYSNATDPFIRLPQDGDTIPNFNGSGPKVIGWSSYTTDPITGRLVGAGSYIPGECADLRDIRTGDWDGTSNNGASLEYDAGGSRAKFIGGDVDCLVVCLSDETVQNSDPINKNTPFMIQDPAAYNLAGAEEGYHGYVSNVGDGKLTDADYNALNATEKIAQAKRHYFMEISDTCNMYHTFGAATGDPTIKQGCDYSGVNYSSHMLSTGPPLLSIGQEFQQAASNLDCWARDCNSHQRRFYFVGFDWDKGVLGTFFCNSPACVPTASTIRNESGSSPIPNGDFAWDNWSSNGYDAPNIHIEPVCGYPTCDNTTPPYNSGCKFDVLSQPTPGYIKDYKDHIISTWPVIKGLDNQPNSAGGVGSLFSTFFYVVSRHNTNMGLVHNPLTHVAAIEGTTLTTAPAIPGGDISVEAILYFNPYEHLDYWHPTNTFGWDPNTSPDWLPNNFGLKHYMKGLNGKCGYNVARGSWTPAQVEIDLNAFISQGGVSCPGTDCILVTTVDGSGTIVPNVSFDFDNTVVTTDGSGEWQTTVPAGIYSFLCNSVSINTSPSTQGQNTDPWMATDPPTAGHTGTFGCNFWRVTLVVVADDFELTENCKLGCTDGTGVNNPIGSSAACNYDPTAGVDDGSCIYADCSDMCPDPNGSVPYIPYVGLDTYPTDSTVFPFSWQWGGGDAYFDVNCPHCCVGGNTGLLPADCVDCLGVCDGNAVYDECGVCDGPGPDECGICFGDGTCCIGCTDPLASNFDPEATIQCDPDCCEYTNIECKLRELARRLLETCEKDCCPTSKEMLLEATMLYTSLFMISEECDNNNGGKPAGAHSAKTVVTTPISNGMNKNKIHSVLKALERLLVKTECGVCCKNC